VLGNLALGWGRGSAGFAWKERDAVWTEPGLEVWSGRRGEMGWKLLVAHGLHLLVSVFPPPRMTRSTNAARPTHTLSTLI
jgi:hypothetical protein